MRCPLLFAVILSVVAGCQAGPHVNQHIELLNSEKRALEEELYELEFEYEDALRDIEQLKRENSQLQKGLGVGPSQPSPARPPSRTRSGVDSGRSKLDLGPPQVDEGMLTEPQIEMPKEQGENKIPIPKSPPPSIPIPKSPPPSIPMTSAPAPASHHELVGPHNLRIEPDDPRVTQLYLNPLLTGGSDFDHQPGDDGLLVVIEPRNGESLFVPLAGPISVVLLDPTQSENSARIARWDLDASEIQQAIRDSSAAKGIELRLPWPQQSPANNRLQLHVRYVTVDGRKLEASREIFVTLPGQVSQRWTPRSSGRAVANADKHRILIGEDATTAPENREVPTQQQGVVPASHLETESAETRP